MCRILVEGPGEMNLLHRFVVGGNNSLFLPSIDLNIRYNNLIQPKTLILNPLTMLLLP